MKSEHRNKSGGAGSRVAAWGRLVPVWSDNAERYTAIALGVLTTFWLLDNLVPTFSQVPAYDDTAYVRSGHWLAADGVLPVFAWGPTLSALYGLFYLVVKESPDWFVWTAAGGRFATYALFYTGIYLCARAIASRSTAQAALVIGSTFPLAASFFLHWNSSDFLFMALSAVALSQLLGYLSDRSSRHLVRGSACVGLAALTRPDGLILLFSFVVLAHATYARDGGAFFPPGWRRRLWLATGPALLLVVGYLVLYGIVTGSWRIGLESRTYQAFEQGHGVIFRERYTGNVMVTGYEDVRSLFGTRDDNDGSVVRAIAKNPSAFVERVAQSVAGLPTTFYRAFGGPYLAVSLVFLASRGALSLWHGRRRWTLLAVTLGWHLHLLAYFATFWQPRYFLFSFVGLSLLAGLGATAIAANWRGWRERTAVAVLLAGLTAWLMWDGGGGRMWGNPAASTTSVTIVVLLGMALCVSTLTLGCRRLRGGKVLALLAGVAMVSGVAVAAGRSPAGRLALEIGASPQEQAVAAAAAVPVGISIATHGFRLPAAARRPVREMGDLMAEPVSASAWDEWLAQSTVGAVYLNPLLRREYPTWFEFLMERLQRDPKWVPVFSDEDAHTLLFVNRSVLEVRGIWRSHEPVLRSEFDVFLLETLLVYVKEGCDQEDTARRFFVHVMPVSVDSLTARQRRKGGRAQLDFDFDRHGFRLDRRCVATMMLPSYEIDYVATGQYSRGEERFWQGRIEFRGGSAGVPTAGLVAPGDS